MNKYSKICMVAFIAIGLSTSLSAMENVDEVAKKEREESSINWYEQIRRVFFGTDQDRNREELNNNNVDEELGRRMDLEEEYREDEKREMEHIQHMLLIENGADINVHGKTTLIWAVQHGHADICLALIEDGADLNVQGDDGNEALESDSE